MSLKLRKLRNSSVFDVPKAPYILRKVRLVLVLIFTFTLYVTLIPFQIQVVANTCFTVSWFHWQCLQHLVNCLNDNYGCSMNRTLEVRIRRIWFKEYTYRCLYKYMYLRNTIQSTEWFMMFALFHLCKDEIVNQSLVWLKTGKTKRRLNPEN